MSANVGHTLVDESDAPQGAEPRTRGAALVLLLEGERPAAGAGRYDLAGVTSVVLGRGQERAAHRPSVHHHADLEVQVPDRRMSGRHAVLTRVQDRWILEDSNSKNGTKVNGRAVEQHRLEDEDVIELGRTVFVFLADQESLEPQDLDAPPPPGEAEVVTLLPAFRRELADLEKLAPQPGVSILLLGESGTGKEVLARQLNTWSKRSGKFVAVNCGAISDTLLESELFGSLKGAFSGATHDRIGLVRSADGGTLFLDEIADLPPSSQAALLRVLQEREVLAVGASQPTRVNIRVIAATHRDLGEAVRQGLFRQDLFARVAGFSIRLPPLRLRRVDIGLLISTLLQGLSERPTRIAPDAVRALFRYSWPLNIRELRNCLSAGLTLAGDDPIQLIHLPEAIREGKLPSFEPATPPRPLSPQQEQHKEELSRLLAGTRGNVSALARDLGKARAQVQRWLKRYGLDPETFKR